MAFCSNCGAKIANEAKFCPECGTPTVVGSEKIDQRQQEYSGKIVKCANCGEVIDAFVAKCPSCGYELRGTKVSESVHEFTLKLEHTGTEEQRIDFIRTFPIPNAKEDIFEYMILASTNITGESRKAVFDAWLVKFDQSYQKAKLVFGNDDDFAKIQTIYEKTSRQIIKEKGIHNVKSAGSVIAKLIALMPNPIFGIVVILIGIVEVIRIIRHDFIGIELVFVVLILWATYKITNTKKQSKARGSAQGAEQEIVKIRYPWADVENAYVLQAKLEQKGFTNIKMINLKDLKVGLFNKSGEINSVSINGKATKPLKKLDPNVSIIITYHGWPHEQ